MREHNHFRRVTDGQEGNEGGAWIGRSPKGERYLALLIVQPILLGLEFREGGCLRCRRRRHLCRHRRCLFVLVNSSGCRSSFGGSSGRGIRRLGVGEHLYAA